ncbi:hypothetical protein JCM11491_005567 [Sporobolomyces phaffii]
MPEHARHRSTRPSPTPTPAPLPTRTSTRPQNGLGPAQTQPLTQVRPAPARRGQPASSRNFAASSAGGATSHLATVKPRHAHGADMSAEQRAKLEQWGDSYIPLEETIRNDYSHEYVSSGARPQNFIRNASVETRFAEYPKLATLLAKKHSLTDDARYSVPPTYLNLAAPGPDAASVALSPLVSSSARFDVILVTPPRELAFETLAALPLASVASNPGFVFLWVGSGQKTFDPSGALVATDGIGLERGRELLSTWGYRRCEDIVWLKTNRTDPGDDLTQRPASLFAPSVEHCLMGIRGTVRRSTDSWFVHCNVDTDVIVWEGDVEDPDLKPPELQSLIENFCLGTRRLHLFGSKKSLRRGWLTVGSPTEEPFGIDSKVQDVEKERSGSEWSAKEWNAEEWKSTWDGREVGPLLPFDEELDSLRPKSPPPRNGQPSSGGLGRGRGAGLGITRSGLVTQAIPRGPAAPIPGAGRGRGVTGARSNTPVAAANGYIFAAAASPSNSSPRANTSQPTSSYGSPYRVHSLAPPTGLASTASHPSLPSRPSFSSQHSSSSGSPSARFGPPPPQRYQNAPFLPQLSQERPPPPSYPPGPFPPPGGSQAYSLPPGHGYSNQPSVPPQQLPMHHSALQAQFSHLSLSQHQAQFSHLSLSQHRNPYPTPPHGSSPFVPNPYQPYSPSPSPQLHPPAPPQHPSSPYPVPPNPYLFVPAAAPPLNLHHPPPPPPPLSSSSSTSSLSRYGPVNGNGAFSGGGPDAEYYPISSSRRPSANGYSDAGGGVYSDAP